MTSKGAVWFDRINELASLEFAFLKLGEERLELRAKLTEMLFQKYWKELKAPEGTVQYNFIWSSAADSFSLFNKVVHVPVDWEGPRNKTEALKRIGTYLTRVKYSAKEICEYMYGKKGCLKSVPKRDRKMEPADILEIFGFVVVGDFQTGRDDGDSAALTLLSTMTNVNDHYTYTLAGIANGTDQQQEGDNISDSDDESDEKGCTEEVEVPRFLSIS